MGKRWAVQWCNWKSHWYHLWEWTQSTRFTNSGSSSIWWLHRPSISDMLPSCVPICPITVSAQSLHNFHERQQIPLKLAYALTIHKSQGLTLSKAWIDIGKSEKTPGVSYVALSQWFSTFFAPGPTWSILIETATHLPRATHLSPPPHR